MKMPIKDLGRKKDVNNKKKLKSKGTCEKKSEKEKKTDYSVYCGDSHFSSTVTRFICSI